MVYDIKIYTDGAAKGNPGPGGYGVVLISGKHRLEKTEGFRLTTNNRMELLAVITGLESLKIPGSNVTVYTDSRYVADAVEKGWLFRWKAKSFKKIKNSDLWKRFLNIYRKHNVKLIWIKGHAGHSENELCDRMAVGSSGRKDLQEDAGYRSEQDDGIFSGDPD